MGAAADEAQERAVGEAVPAQSGSTVSSAQNSQRSSARSKQANDGKPIFDPYELKLLPCLTSLQETLEDMMLNSYAFISDNRSANAEVLLQKIEERLSGLDLERKPLRQWLQDNASDLQENVPRQGNESWTAWMLTAFVRRAATVYRSVEAQSVAQIADVMFNMLRGLVDGRVQTLRDEPEIIVNFVLDLVEQRVQRTTQPELMKTMHTLSKFCKKGAAPFVKVCERLNENTEAVLAGWIFDVIIYAYENGFVFQPTETAASTWDSKQVAVWLSNIRLQQYANNFINAGVHGKALLELTDFEIERCLEVDDEDARQRLLRAIEALIQQEEYVIVKPIVHSRWTLEKNDATAMFSGFDQMASRAASIGKRTGKQLWKTALFKVRMSRRMEDPVNRELRLHSDSEILNLTQFGLAEKHGKLLADFMLLNSSIRTLQLSMNRLAAGGIGLLARGLKKNMTVKELSLASNDMGDNGAMCVATIITETRSIKDIDVGNNLITDKGAGQISKALISNPRISRILFYHNKLTYVSAESFIKVFQSNPKILIDISENPLGSRGVAVLSTALKRFWSHARLDIRTCSCGVQGVKLLSEALMNERVVKTLFLSNNAFGPKGAEHLAAGLLKNFTIRELDLSGCGIGDEGCKQLARMLNDNSTIQYIDLADNDVTDFGVKLFGSLFAHLGKRDALAPSALQRVIFNENPITFIGLSAVASSLTYARITHIDFANCAIDDDGARKLAGNLGQNTFVRMIDLSANGLTADGIWVLAERALSVNRTLEVLKLTDNDIRDAGARALAKVLKTNDVLQELHLGGNSIRDDGAKALAEAALARKGRLELFLHGNLYSATAKGALSDASRRATMFYFFD